MNVVGRIVGSLVTLVGIVDAARPVAAQTATARLSSNVVLDEADSLVKGTLERAKALIANRRWDEAIDTFRQLADQHGEKVVAVAPGYYVRLRDDCHRRISTLPPEALGGYQDQVDRQAAKWLEEGLAAADERLLRRLVDTYYCSRRTDEALWALSELALARGDFAAARSYCEQLIDTPPAELDADEFTSLRGAADLKPEAAELLDRFYRRHAARPAYELFAERSIDPLLMQLAALVRERGIAGRRAAYPRPDIPPADVFARLIVVSLFEGSTSWAEAGLRDFAAVFPDARGRIAGREVNYVAGLQALAEEAKAWRRSTATTDWTTLGGNAARNGASPHRLELGRVLWRKPLEPVVAGDHDTPRRRVGEDKKALLSYHPVVVGRSLFLNTGNEIRAYDLATGDPLWGSEARIFQIEAGHAPGYGSRQVVGSPRYTLSVCGRRLLARIGNPVTSQAGDFGSSGPPAKIVCLNLDAEGSVLWTADPPEEGWAFDGCPLADDERAYVALRKGGVRPQFHAACYDLDSVGVGRLLWRRPICAAESPAQGQADEITHNLPTLAGDDVYYNTSLGAVAALDKRSGSVRWVTTYPRAIDADLHRRSTHLFRDLTPCVFDRGTVYAAPADSRHILAIDAAAGWLRWETTLADDAIHLPGVAGDQLLASGDRLWWIHAVTGRVTHVWPDESPKGYGRGVVAGDQVAWPTRTTLELFGTAGARQRREIELTVRELGGGNLVPAGDYVVVAGGTELVVLDRRGGVSTRSEPADAAHVPTSGDAPK